MTSNSRKLSDLELIIMNYTREKYESKYNKRNIPMALKYLIISFSKKIIGCDMLTFKEDIDFFQLLSTKISSKIKKFKVLFIASDHDYSALKFKEHCNNKGPTITIIKSNFGNIFGGYTSKKWCDRRWVSDESAFLFLIRSKDRCLQAFNIKKRKCDQAIFTDISRGYGPTFGGGNDIFIGDKCNEIKRVKKNDNYTFQHSYDIDDVNLSGSNDVDDKNFDYPQYFFTVIDYYVIQIKTY